MRKPTWRAVIQDMLLAVLIFLTAGLIAGGFKGDACAQSGYGTLSIQDLMGKTWQFSKGDGSVIAEKMKFLQGGRLEGYLSPNEARWGAQGKALVFYNDAGKVSTRFNSFKQENGKWIISGPSLLNRNIIHVLKEVGDGAPAQVVAHTADQQAVAKPVGRAYTALISAINQGNAGEVQRLANSGFDLNSTIPNYPNRTLLDYAFIRWTDTKNDGNKEIVKLLLSKGAKISDVNGAYNYAMKNGHKDVADLLTSKGGGDLNVMLIKVINGRFNPQMMDKESRDAVESLIAKGADVNAVDRTTGNSALMASSMYGDLEIVRLLIAKGADVNYKNTMTNVKVLQIAEGMAMSQKTKERQEIVKLLKAKGAKK